MNINNGKVSDLLKNFVAPEDQNIVAKKDAVYLYKDSIYYQNQYDGDNLYVYNTLTKTNIRVTSTPVNDSYIYQDYLYYRQVSYFVNKYLYRIDLKNGGEPTLISTDDCVKLKIYDDKISFRYLTGIGYTTKQLAVTDLNGENVDVLLEDVDPNSFTIVNDAIYFNNDVTGSYSVNSYNLITKEHKIIKKGVYAYNLSYVNGKLYYQSYINGSGVLGDGHFYELTMDGNLVKVDKL